MLSVRFFSILSLRLLFAFSFSLAMEEKKTLFENTHITTMHEFTISREINSQDYAVFLAVQGLKQEFIEVLKLFYTHHYDLYKKDSDTIKMKRDPFDDSSIQGLFVSFSTNNCCLFTFYGQLNLIPDLALSLKEKKNKKHFERNKTLLAKFKEKLLKQCKVSIDSKNNEFTIYKIYSFNKMTLPEPKYSESDFIDPHYAKNLWQAMEEKYKKETNTPIST